jgi:hypothetical protein
MALRKTLFKYKLHHVARDHPLGQASPSCIRMDVMVGTDARQAWMLAAASSRSARDDTADGAELHQARRRPAQRSTNAAAVPRLTLVTLPCRPLVITRIVSRGRAAVYSPTVLRLRGHASARQSGHHGRRTMQPLTQRRWAAYWRRSTAGTEASRTHAAPSRGALR